MVILGSFVIQTVVGWLIDFWATDDGAFQATHAYGIALAFLIVPGLLATIWYWMRVDALQLEQK